MQCNLVFMGQSELVSNFAKYKVYTYSLYKRIRKDKILFRGNKC